MWNNRRAQIVDDEIINKIRFASVRLRFRIPYLITQKEITKKGGESFGIVTIIVGVFQEFLQKHAYIEKNIAV